MHGTRGVYLVTPLQVLGVVALCTDSLSADDFLPAMASVLPRAALRRLASDVISVTNFSWREDFEDMWLFHFVASIGLMAQLASASPASASQSAAAAAAAAAEPLPLLAPQGSAGEGGEGGEEGEEWEDVSSFEPQPPTDDAAAPPPDATSEPRARGRGPTHLSNPHPSPIPIPIPIPSPSPSPSPSPGPSPSPSPNPAPNPHPRRGITLGRLINNAGQIAAHGIALLPSYPAVCHTQGSNPGTSRAHAALVLLLTRLQLALDRPRLPWAAALWTPTPRWSTS